MLLCSVNSNHSMRVRMIFDQCSNQPCCNNEMYKPHPSCLTSHDNKLYRIELVSQSPDQTIQSLLDESHNNFTDHADVSCDAMGHPCGGRRRTKVTVTQAPVLLKVYMAVFQNGQTVFNSSQFETCILLHCDVCTCGCHPTQWVSFSIN